MQKLAILLAVVVSIAVVQGTPQVTSMLRPAIQYINSFRGNEYSNSTPNQARAQHYQNNYEPSSNYQTQQQYVQPQASHQTQNFYQNSGGSCDGIFSYQSDYGGNYGFVTIHNPDYSRNVLRLEMTLAARLPSNYYGEIDLAKSIQSSANDVANGQPLTYKVKFPLQNPLPKVTAVYLNNQLICSGAKDREGYVTTIYLEYVFTTGLSEGLSNQRQPVTQAPVYQTQAPVYQTQPPVYQTQPPPVYQTTSRPVYQTTRRPIYQTTRRPVYQTTRRPVYQTTQPAQGSQNYNIDRTGSQCGVPDFRVPTTTGLVVGGKYANRGQFPWLAAYYHNSESSNGFICGGSLVSSKIVVTAAHCVQNKNEYKPRTAEEATFYLGKYYLDALHSEKGFIRSDVYYLEVHPDWRYSDEKWDADIAIAVLMRTIHFTKFIKPICLWTGSSEYQDMIGHSGIVAGWGKTEFNADVSDRPKWTMLPVVSESECLRSGHEFQLLTSPRSFCAGDTRNNGPCDGDSGGGFIMNNGNKWYLRGIVSASSFDAALSMCDAKKPAVFTNVAQFNSWIQGYTRQYG